MELTLLRFSLFLFFVARLNLNAPNKRDHPGLPKKPTPIGAGPIGDGVEYQLRRSGVEFRNLNRRIRGDPPYQATWV